MRATRRTGRYLHGAATLAAVSLILIGTASAQPLPYTGEPAAETSALHEESGEGAQIEDGEQSGPIDGSLVQEVARDIDDASGSGYTDPDHVDVRTVVDAETGEQSEVLSGITHWEPLPTAPRAMALGATTTDVLAASISPNTGSIAADGVPRMRIDLAIPAGSQAGDVYPVDVSVPWLYPSDMAQALEIKDANGRVFAVAQGHVISAPNTPDRRARLAITLTEDVETHANIVGFLEFSLTYFLRTTEQSIPVIASSDGAEIGRSGTWVIPAEPAQDEAVAANGGVVDNGRPAIRPFIRISADRIGSAGWTVSFSELAPGLSPTCTGLLSSRGPDSDGFIRDRNVAVPATTCTPGSQSFVVTEALAQALDVPPSGLVTFRTSMTGERALTEYSVRVTTSLPLSILDGGTSRVVSAITGDPSLVGANSLSLKTEKTATTTPSNGDPQPTVGDSITYTITTTPGGDNQRAITNLVTTDVLPEGLEFVSASGSGTHDPGTRTVSWGPRTLTSTGRFTDTVEARIVALPPSDSVTNRVTNTATGVCGEDDQQSICTAEVSTPLARPGFEFTKSSSVTDTNQNGWLGDLGDAIHYVFTVENTGGVTLSSAKLTDETLTIQDAECLTAPLQPGASAACSGTHVHVITQADVDAGSVANHATLCIDPDLGVPCENDSTETPIVNPSFTFDKKILGVASPEGARVAEGKAAKDDVIHYGFSVQNTGNVDIGSLLVTDPLLGAHDMQCLSPDSVLKPGEIVDCTDTETYFYAVTAADQSAGKVHNVAVGKVPGLPEEIAETTIPIVAPPPITELPETGADGTRILLGAGAGLLLAGITVSVLAARKRHRHGPRG